MKVLCIGESTMEITCPLNGTLNEGDSVITDERLESCGGTSGNIAYLLAKWGVESFIASMLGADDFADKIKKEYENIGTRTEYLETSYDKKTGLSFIMLNNLTKNSTVIDIATNSPLKKYSFVDEPDIIVSDGIDLNGTITAFDKYPKAKRFLIVKHNNNITQELCRYANYIIFNKNGAEEITGLKIDFNDSGTLVSVYNRIKQKFDKAEVVLTIGERGSIYSINGQVKVMPALKVDIVDTYGAGDIFAGSFIYAIGREFGLEKGIAYATIAASISTTKMTSRGSIPAITDVSNYYDSKFGTQNNPINNVSNSNDKTVNMSTMADNNMEQAPVNNEEKEEQTNNIQEVENINNAN